jgi:hypothetical protein
MPRQKKKSIIRTDDYTSDDLRERFTAFKNYVRSYLHLRAHIRKLIRAINIPEDISENIVKFIIRNILGHINCSWCKSLGMSGDLIDVEGGVEVKAFSSPGPSSFGPRKKFDVIYFLDMRNWIDDVIILWKVNLSNESPQWKALKMNKKEDNKTQCDRGVRPHIAWSKIYPQISEHCTKVYEGTFEGIFIPVVKEVVAEQSVVLPELTQHSLPVCTGENQPMQESYTPPEIPEN